MLRDEWERGPDGKLLLPGQRRSGSDDVAFALAVLILLAIFLGVYGDWL